MRRLRVDPGLLMGFLAQALQYGAGLILMPFVVSRLSMAEVGIWYVFLAAQGLVAVVDFGFQPTFARFFSLARSGVATFTRDGIGAPGNGEPNIALTGALLRVAQRLYAALALAILIVLVAAGMPYLAGLVHGGGLDIVTVQIAWAIFAIAIAASLYFMWIPSFLLGSDRVVANYAYLILSRGGFALFGIAALLAGGGLVALAMGFLAGQVAARLLAVLLLRGSPTTAVRGVPRDEARAVLGAIWPNASRLGMVAIGTFFISRYNVFLLSGTNGLAASARYAICLQLLSGIASVGQLPAQASLPRIVAARVSGDTARFRRIVLSAAGFYIGLFALAATILVLAGDPLLRLIGSTVSLLDPPVLILFALVIALEGFHSMAAFIITTRNAVPFVWPALLSGAGVAVLATVAAKSGYGVVGVIACQGLIQLAYNNWKWPVMVYRECRQ